MFFVELTDIHLGLLGVLVGLAGLTTSEAGDYLAVWQYSFMAAEIIGPILFGTLFTVHHSIPFLVVLVLNLAAIPALGMLRGRVGTAALERAASVATEEPIP